MKKLFVTILAVAALCSAPAMAMPAGPNWTGCYVGANLGYGWQKNDTDDIVSPNYTYHTGSGVMGGAQIGCDYQFADKWIVGAQGMMDGSGITDRQFYLPQGGDEILAFTSRWLATLEARLGYTITPQLLVYAKGGWAAANIDSYDYSEGFFGYHSNSTRQGWTIGGGSEYQFAPHWSLFGEYNYIDLGTHENALKSYYINGGYPPETIYRETHDIHMVLVGVNYRFSGL